MRLWSVHRSRWIFAASCSAYIYIFQTYIVVARLSTLLPPKGIFHESKTTTNTCCHRCCHSLGFARRHNFCRLISRTSMFSMSNPHGLSKPELDSVTNGGNYGESEAARARRLGTEVRLGQARVKKLQGWMAEGHTHEPTSIPLDARFQKGGKYALSDQEQKWTNAPVNPLPLADQLRDKQQQVVFAQEQLKSLQILKQSN